MENYYWMKKVDALAAKLAAKGGKLDSCFGKNREAIYRGVAALRVAGLQEGAEEFECNFCGETFRISGQHETHPGPVAVIRGNVPCVMCHDCAINFPVI